jgi:gamma-glutamyltranspeptidase / glutathione hydrolase
MNLRIVVSLCIVYCLGISVLLADNNYAQGNNGVVAAPDKISADAALKMMKKGGNAIDAAIACALTAGVSQPQTSGVGGGAYAMIYIAKENKCYFLDFQHIAPQKATVDAYKYDEKGKVVDNRNNFGYRSIAIPGQMRGLEAMSKKFGNLAWKNLFSPAISAARDGYPMSNYLSHYVKDIPRSFPKEQFLQWALNSYFKEGKPLPVGATIKNPDLAKTLETLRDGGADEFYTGKIAKIILAQYKSVNDDWITAKDLADYKVQWLKPLEIKYRNCKVLTAPPPGYGGAALAEYLNILNHFELKKSDRASAQTIYILSEALKRSWQDVYKYIGDPKFINNPLDKLLSDKYASEIKDAIVAGPVNGVNKLVVTPGCTTTMSVADKDGNMVTITDTLAGIFGAAVVINGTGIIMNDKMGDFNLKDKNHVKYIQPGKAAPTSMAPTFVFKDGKPFMSIGSAGSDRIPGAIAQPIINAIDYGMNLKEAIDYPRLNNQNQLETQYEGGIFDKGVGQLEKDGLKFNRWPPPINTYFAGTQAVMFSDGKYHACGDPRRYGVAEAVMEMTTK